MGKTKAITNNDIAQSARESINVNINRTMDTSGVDHACKSGTNIATQFYANCHATHSKFNQNLTACEVTNKGQKSNVDNINFNSTSDMQKTLAARSVQQVLDKSNCKDGLGKAISGSTDVPATGTITCSALGILGKTGLIHPGSGQMNNLATSTAYVGANIMDTMKGTCSENTGGINSFMCVNSTIDNLEVDQQTGVKDIADCSMRNINKGMVSQYIGESIVQSSSLGYGNILQDIIVVIIIIVGTGAGLYILTRGRNKPSEKDPTKKQGIMAYIRIKLLALFFIILIVIMSILYVRNSDINIGFLPADLTSTPLCPDCTIYDNEPECVKLGLCSWLANPTDFPQCSPTAVGAPTNCLSPSSWEQQLILKRKQSGICKCGPIIDPKINKNISDCSSQCPNFNNEKDCVKASCGWKPEETELYNSPSICINLGNTYECSTYTNQDQCLKSSVNNACAWITPTNTKVVGGGSCTGSKTYCHPRTKLSNKIDLKQTLIY